MSPRVRAVGGFVADVLTTTYIRLAFVVMVIALGVIPLPSPASAALEPSPLTLVSVTPSVDVQAGDSVRLEGDGFGGQWLDNVDGVEVALADGSGWEFVSWSGDGTGAVLATMPERPDGSTVAVRISDINGLKTNSLDVTYAASAPPAEPPAEPAVVALDPMQFKALVAGSSLTLFFVIAGFVVVAVKR